MKSTNTKGFTLVELIIVITILAILATIAFISFQGYTKDARNSKRESDLNSIKQSIEVKVANAVPVTSMVTTPLGDEDMRVKKPQAINTNNGTTIAGYNLPDFDSGEAMDGKYRAGEIDFNIIGAKADDFKDPKGDTYKIGVTTLAGGKYEIISDNYENNSGTGVKGIGNWKARNNNDIIVNVKEINGSSFILKDGLGISKVGDLVDIKGTIGIITGISKDLSTLTIKDEDGINFSNETLDDFKTHLDDGGLTIDINGSEIISLICHGAECEKPV